MLGVSCATEKDMTIALDDAAAAEFWTVGQVLAGTGEGIIRDCRDHTGEPHPFARAIAGIESLTIGGVAYAHHADVDWASLRPGTPGTLMLRTAATAPADLFEDLTVDYHRNAGAHEHELRRLAHTNASFHRELVDAHSRKLWSLSGLVSSVTDTIKSGGEIAAMAQKYLTTGDFAIDQSASGGLPCCELLCATAACCGASVPLLPLQRSCRSPLPLAVPAGVRRCAPVRALLDPSPRHVALPATTPARATAPSAALQARRCTS